MAEQAASETFVEYARRTGLRFSDWLRDQAEPAWTRAVEHRFTHEIADDALDESVFKRYLTNEYSFVVTAATLLGYAIAKAPSMDEKARLAEGLRGLTTEQRAFFMRAFARRSGCTRLGRSEPFAAIRATPTMPSGSPCM